MLQSSMFVKRREVQEYMIETSNFTTLTNQAFSQEAEDGYLRDTTAS